MSLLSSSLLRVWNMVFGGCLGVSPSEARKVESLAASF
jgi:hypothetical protein